MSSRAPRSAYSSRDVSPETHPDFYDPFHSESDPIELAHLTRPDPDARDSFGSHGRSPSPPPGERGRSRPESYFGLSHSTGQYAPLSDRNQSPQPSNRSTKESTHTFTGLYRSKAAVDADTQALVDRRAGEIAQWRIHWTTPALIITLFIAGVIAAIGHHIFYARLNGRPATKQLKMVRYGTALAFFVKSTLVGTVIMCNRQRIWRTFRRRAMTVTAIDGLFSATEDATQFFTNWEMIRNAKLATFMAACSWAIPLASVLSPAALTSEMSTEVMNTTCSTVATLNFTREALFNFRDETEIDGRVNSLNYYNTTDPTGKTEGFFDYYDQASRNARRLAFSSAYLKKPQARDNAQLIFCGEQWNCTYSINFLGPGYQCEDKSDADDAAAPFKLSQLAPEGNFTYLADVDQDDYIRPQIDTRDGTPVQDPPYPASLGVFEHEPPLWIGYANRTTDLYPTDSPYAKKWQYVHVPKIFKCVMHHTNYTYQMNYNPSQTATRKQRDFLEPVVDTTIKLNPDNSSDWIASPTSNFIRPSSDPEKYKLTASYHSLGTLLRNFLRGDIEKTSDIFIITRSDISETRLINGTTSYPQSTNLQLDVEEFFEDTLITLLSEPTLVLAEAQAVPCERTRTLVVYRYRRENLWVGYAVAIFITFVFILVGAWSIHQNGVASDVLFSRIMVTTRNPTLDHLSVGACLGGDPFPKELIKTKLRFGVLREHDPREGPLGKVEHCCFGTVGETKEIVKGGTYAGLRKWRDGGGGGGGEGGGWGEGGKEEKEPLLGKGGGDSDA